jgi:hypothetical protein
MTVIMLQSLSVRPQPTRAMSHNNGAETQSVRQLDTASLPAEFRPVPRTALVS